MPTGEPQPDVSAVETDLPLTVYSPESPLRHPVRLTGEILSDLWRCRELTWTLFTRDLKAQYRQSYLGYIWIFVPVISTTVVWMFLNSSGVIRVENTPIPYPAYVLLGSVIWGVFNSSVNQPLNSFNAGRQVFMKLKVPPEAFVLSGLGGVAFETIIRTLVLIPVFMFLKMTPATTAWLFPIGIACVALIGLSVGFLMIPLGSLYSDVSRLVGTGLTFLMYLSAVVYPPPPDGWAAKVISWNPVTAMVMTTRDWLTLGHSSYLSTMLITTGIAVIVLFFGLIIFRVVMPHLIERMGM